MKKYCQRESNQELISIRFLDLCMITNFSGQIKKKNKSDRVQTSDAFCRSARVVVSELSFNWLRFMSLVLFCSNSTQFSEIQPVCDGRTDRPTNGRTDGQALL